MKYHYFFETYQTFDEIIGDGHYGVVYKGMDMVNDTYVAIKKLKMERYPPLPKLELPHLPLPRSVKKEIEILEKLKHKNIVTLLEVIIEDSRQISLIFEYLPMDLFGYLDRLPMKIFMDPRLVKSYLYQITTVLIFCQHHSVVHRDIKTGNLLITTDGVIKLADFGFAISVDVPHDHYKTDIGTICYRAPELLLGTASLYYPIDIWALGCVFAEMVTKDILFESDDTRLSQLSKIFEVLTTPTEEMWKGVTGVSDFVELPKFDRDCLEERVPQLGGCGLDLLRAMLAYDPEKRITAKEIVSHPYFGIVDFGAKPNFEILDYLEID